MTRLQWKRWISLLLAAILLTALLSSCSGGSSQGDSLPGTSSASSYEAEVIRLVNEIRTEQGLPALTTNSSLSNAAALRAEEIVTLYSHTRPDGSSCFTVLPAFGISYRAAGGKHRGWPAYTCCCGECLDELFGASGQYSESKV